MQRFLSSKMISAAISANRTSFFPKTNPIHPQNASGNLGPKPQKIFGIFSNPREFFPKPNANALFKTPGNAILDCKFLFFRNSGTTSNYTSFYNSTTRWFQRLGADQVLLGLIITNVAIFLLWPLADPTFMTQNFMISVDSFRSGHVHTLITSAFSHKDLGHLVPNMIGLYFFGTSIGRTFGPGFLLKLYLSGALAGSVFYLVYHAFLTPSKGTMSHYVRGLGASGAVNAIMLLDIFLRPTATLYFDFIIPVPAILLGIYIIGQDMLRMIEGDTQISGSAHMGGAAVAVMAWARYRKRRFY